MEHLPILIIGALVLFVLFLCLRIVNQAEGYVIEMLGKYQSTWESGVHFMIPGLQRVVRKVSFKEQVADFPPQPVITKDNVTMRIDTVVYFKVFDAELFTYGVENPIIALENLTATTLRNIVGDLELDDTLTSRDTINSQMKRILDEATDAWGIKVNRVELKNIIPPEDIQEAMEKQMRAEREKRQTLLEAEAHKESVVKRAEGDKAAKVLAAEAERDAQIALAKGRAESIKLVYNAEANGLAMLKQAGVDDKIIKLKQIEALKDVADGNATKIFLPSDLTNALNMGVTGELWENTPINRKKPVAKDPVDDCCDDKDIQTQNLIRTGERIEREVKRK